MPDHADLAPAADIPVEKRKQARQITLLSLRPRTQVPYTFLRDITQEVGWFWPSMSDGPGRLRHGVFRDERMRSDAERKKCWLELTFIGVREKHVNQDYILVD